MRVKSIGPNNLGVADGSQIVMSDGEEWSVQFVFEDRFDVCKKAERYYSYIYELEAHAVYRRRIVVHQN